MADVVKKADKEEPQGMPYRLECFDCGGRIFHVADFIEFKGTGDKAPIESFVRRAYRCEGCNRQLNADMLIKRDLPVQQEFVPASFAEKVETPTIVGAPPIGTVHRPDFVTRDPDSN